MTEIQQPPNRRGPSPRQPLDQLLLQVKSPDPEERFEAVAELASGPASPEVEEALFQAISDPDPDVVALAMEEMAERGHPMARRVVLSNLHHPNPVIRFTALRSGGVIDISPDTEPAWCALDSRVWVDRTAGASALARAGVVSAVTRILSLARKALAVRQYEAEAHLLGSAALLGDEASAKLYLERLPSQRRRSRLAAAAFLERRGRIKAMARVLGAQRLRSALLAGREVQAKSTKPGYARHFDDLLNQLDALPAP